MNKGGWFEEIFEPRMEMFVRNIKDFKEKLLSVNGMILSLSLSMIFLALKRSLKKKYRFASGRVLL